MQSSTSIQLDKNKDLELFTLIWPIFLKKLHENGNNI